MDTRLKLYSKALHSLRRISACRCMIFSAILLASVAACNTPEESEGDATESPEGRKFEALTTGLADSRISVRSQTEEDFILNAVPLEFIEKYSRSVFAPNQDGINLQKEKESAESLRKKRIYREQAFPELVKLSNRPEIHCRKSALRLIARAAVDPDELHYLGVIVEALGDPVPEVGFTAYAALIRRFPAAEGRRALDFDPFEHDPQRRKNTIMAWRSFFQSAIHSNHAGVTE